MWSYQGNPFDHSLIDGNMGYIYLITNTVSGRRYIGKKLFFFAKTSIKTVTLKNGTKKKKKIKSQVPSDWQDYWSSSDELKKDVESLGETNFTREILYLCKTKGMMGYLEAKLQFQHEVLEYPTEWYNRIVNCKIHAIHVKELHKCLT